MSYIEKQAPRRSLFSWSEYSQHPHPQPHPLLPPPQKQERSRIQISHSQQSLPPLFPQPHPPPKIPPPLPPQQHNNRIIQIQFPPKKPLLFPPLQELFAQPQFVAVKSLILLPPSFIYGLLYDPVPVNVSCFQTGDLNNLRETVKRLISWGLRRCQTRYLFLPSAYDINK